MVTNVILASPSGFCAGVSRAIYLLDTLSKKENPEPIYVLNEIVHNRYIIENFTNRGVIFIKSLNDLPPAAKKIVFSAHGVSPEVINSAKAKGLKVVNATCPLVSRVHKMIKNLTLEGYNIILIGHRGHDEVVGSSGWAKGGRIEIIETESDIESLPFKNTDKLAYVTQTTLSVRDIKNIVARLIEKYPNILPPEEGCICYATQNRQLSAQAVSKMVDSMLIVGSNNSSNTLRLYEISKENTKAFRVDSAEEITPAMLSGKIGIIAGASAPKILVDDIIKKIEELKGKLMVDEVKIVDENLHFAPAVIE